VTIWTDGVALSKQFQFNQLNLLKFFNTASQLSSTPQALQLVCLRLDIINCTDTQGTTLVPAQPLISATLVEVVATWKLAQEIAILVVAEANRTT
jgi:hypothetical protein